MVGLDVSSTLNTHSLKQNDRLPIERISYHFDLKIGYTYHGTWIKKHSSIKK